MPKPTAIPLRRCIDDLWKQNWTAVRIAEHLKLPIRTVRNLIQRFQKLGEAGIEASYTAGPKAESPQREQARLVAEQLRREHPTWGAGLIGVYLKRADEASAPSGRTVQRWLSKAGLMPAPAGRRPATNAARAAHPHAVWQLDASEEISLETGRKVSWLRVADECTGAVLETRVFPLGALESGGGS